MSAFDPFTVCCVIVAMVFAVLLAVCVDFCWADLSHIALLYGCICPELAEHLYLKDNELNPSGSAEVQGLAGTESETRQTSHDGQPLQSDLQG